MVVRPSRIQDKDRPLKMQLSADRETVPRYGMVESRTGVCDERDQPRGSDCRNRNDRVPAWIVPFGIKEGGWFISKARAKRAVTSKCFSPAARIHICLELATMGFQQKLAVKMVGGNGARRVPRTAKGRVELYSWLVPRPVDVKKIVIAR